MWIKSATSDLLVTFYGHNKRPLTPGGVQMSAGDYTDFRTSQIFDKNGNVIADIGETPRRFETVGIAALSGTITPVIVIGDGARAASSTFQGIVTEGAFSTFTPKGKISLTGGTPDTTSIPANSSRGYVTIKSDKGNADLVYPYTDATKGVPLDAGESRVFDVTSGISLFSASNATVYWDEIA